jgi:hypothetical protein
MLLLTIAAAAPLAPAASSAADIPVTQGLLAWLAGAIVAASTLTAVVTIFILRQLSNNRALTYSVKDEIMKAIAAVAKDFRYVMSRHNREDDDRFEIIYRELWQLHLRNAARDKTMPPAFQPLPRRRYMEEDDASDDPLRHSSDVRLAGITGFAEPSNTA